jgi:autotransporter-associated beta strand protein
VHLGVGTVGVTMYSQAANNSVIPVGELTGDPGSTLGFGNNVSWRIGGLGTDAAFAGNISSANVSLIKEGAGTWTLTGAVTDFSGSTTVSNGVLALATNGFGDVSISNSTTIAISAPGVLDVSGRSDKTLSIGTFTNTQTLRGTGTLRGSLQVGAFGILAPGFSIGTLTVTNAVTLGGAAEFELDRGASPNSDRLAAPSIAAGGTLTVTNLGAALHAGDSFQLFSTAVSGSFAVVNLPTNDPVNQVSYTWTNRLAINGTIAVLTAIGQVNTNPAPITFQAAGGLLTLTWPADHIGWRLQAQTNAPGAGLSTNWVTVSGATTTNRYDVQISPANGPVFFRLIYP